NTSAGRASAVNVVQRPRSTQTDSGSATAEPETEEPEQRKERGKGLFITLAALLVLVVAAGATVWYVRDSLSQSYFIAVAENGAAATTTSTTTPLTVPAPASASASELASAPASAAPTEQPTAPAETGPPIQIYQGAPGNILGISTQSVYQEVCLSDDAEVRLLPAGSDDDCHRFSTSDLTPAARGTLDNLPRDSYEEIQGQIRRLAEQTLPVCVTRDNAADARSGEPSDLTTPGVSCREVD
ncbi:MAG: serine/threonine-protein phosphatase, partial [Corynebacterium sp.]|nr:serine/threonine-protein phosphatase [Corynebacterium sp.]